MLIDALKTRIAQAVKDKDGPGRDVLRLAFGEIQTAEARAGKPPSDAEMIAIVRKLVKSNEETLTLGGEGPNAPTLRHEIAILSELLPKTMSVADLTAALAPQRDAILAAKGDGQATGVAMKYLKTTDAVFEGTDVTAAVKAMRA